MVVGGGGNPIMGIPPARDLPSFDERSKRPPVRRRSTCSGMSIDARHGDVHLFSSSTAAVASSLPDRSLTRLALADRTGRAGIRHRDRRRRLRPPMLAELDAHAGPTT